MITIPRHGAAAEDADRSLGIRAAAEPSSGGSMGGMQALEWAVAYPERVVVRDSHRHHGAAQRAADRLQRSGTPGHHGRPGLERRRLLRRQASGARAGRGAHGGPHHLHERPESCARSSAGASRSAARSVFEVESYLQYRGNKFVDRFDANSYIYITQGHGLLRSDRSAARWRSLFERASRPGFW